MELTPVGDDRRAPPRTRDEAASRTKLHPLLEVDVTFLLDLIEAGEYRLKPYTPLLQEEATLWPDNPASTDLHSRYGLAQPKENRSIGT
jgi:hypothetical protein